MYRILFALLWMSFGANAAQPVDLLKEAFPGSEDEFIFPDYVYLAWSHEGDNGRYGYQVDGDTFYYAERSVDNKSVTKFTITISQCYELRQLIDQLKPSLYRSTAMILGYEPELEPEVIVLDGYSYSLEFISGYDSVRLTGQGSSEYEYTWIPPAEKVKAKALECKRT